MCRLPTPYLCPPWASADVLHFGMAAVTAFRIDAVEKNKRIVLVAASIDDKVRWLRALMAALPALEHAVVRQVMAPLLQAEETPPGWELTMEAVQVQTRTPLGAAMHTGAFHGCTLASLHVRRPPQHSAAHPSDSCLTLIYALAQPEGTRRDWRPSDF